ncbi:uncharacterized protein LOC124124566 [Haliotis rufescens]|uniref:uncharacterized protein LOC124124566 n=1 Tax=Haliotis rufescens TaxID=6454 RepID=UPI00201F34DE|nr:uncharacterized protein LOC124124566 [Haliotis rufescens]
MKLYTFSVKWHCLCLLATYTCCCTGNKVELKLQAIQDGLTSAQGVIGTDILPLVDGQCPCGEGCDNVTSSDNVAEEACFECQAQIINLLFDDLLDQLQVLKNLSDTDCKDCSFIVAVDSKLVALNRFNTTLSIESIVNAGGIVGVDGNVTYFTAHDSGETKIITRNCDGEEVELTTYPSGFQPTGITYSGQSDQFILTTEASGTDEPGTYRVNGSDFTLLPSPESRQTPYTRNTFYPSPGNDSVLVASGTQIFSIPIELDGNVSLFYDYPYFNVTALDLNSDYSKLYFGDDQGRLIVKNIAAGCYKIIIAEQGRHISDLKVDPCTGDVAIVYLDENVVEFVDPLNGTVTNVVNYVYADFPSIAFLNDYMS